MRLLLRELLLPKGFFVTLHPFAFRTIIIFLQFKLSLPLLTMSPFILRLSFQVTDLYRRDMYYRDPELFVKQAVVDRYVDDIAYTLGIERDALNVVSVTFLRGLLFLISIGMPGCCS